MAGRTHPPTLSETRVRVLALLAVLMFLAGLFTAMDFDQVYMALTGQVAFADWPRPLAQGSAVIRMLRSVLCLVLVLQVSTLTQLRRRDDTLLTAAFVFAVIGDFFLIFRTGAPNWFFLVGVAAFLVCHGVLSVRHLTGFRADLAKPGVVPRLVVSAVLIALVLAGIVALFWDIMKIPLDLVYMGTLGFSLWAAVGAALRADDSDFPRMNRWLIAVGLFLFTTCDVALGVNARMVGAEGHTQAALMIGLIPDLTYSWALILLALSGFRWDVLTDRQASAPVA